MTKDSKTWFIEPRDPVVVRDGRLTTELGAAAPFPFPPPSTIAGMVRSCFVAGQSHVTPEKARSLLQIKILRGPFLVQQKSGESGFTHWLSVPSDAVVEKLPSQGDEKACERLRRAEVITLGENEGVIWPEDSPSLCGLVKLAAKDEKGNKTTPLVRSLPFWPLDHAVNWALGHGSSAPYPPLPTLPSDQALKEEQRIHVAIDGESQTAEPGMLYATPGLRFAEGFGIGVEIEAPEDFNWPKDEGFIQLGGEARPSFRTTAPKAAFPLFGDYESKYRDAAEANPQGIRIELLTPAWLHQGSSVGTPAWLPSWLESGRHPKLPSGMKLDLVATCLLGFIPISGWNMQGGKDGHGAPRPVRRLTPAGTVFYFRLKNRAGGDASAAELLEAARALWAVPIEPEPEGASASLSDFLAPAARDGFGLMLPGFWWQDKGPSVPEE